MSLTMRIATHWSAIATTVFMLACGRPTPPAQTSGAHTSPSPSVAASDEADISSPDALTAWAARVLSASAPEMQVKAASTLTLTSGTLVISLDRVWSFCAQNKADCTAMARDYLAQVKDVIANAQSSTGPSPEQLRPALRTKDIVDSYQAGGSCVAEPFVGDLWVVYMLDTPSAASPLSHEVMQQLGLTVEEVRAKAIANLRAEIGSLNALIKTDLAPNAIGQVQPLGYYNSSLLLLSDEWKAVAARVGSPLRVAVPAPEMLMYAYGDGPMAAEALAAISNDYMRRAERALSPMVFEWTPAGFRPYAKMK